MARHTLFFLMRSLIPYEDTLSGLDAQREGYQKAVKYNMDLVNDFANGKIDNLDIDVVTKTAIKNAVKAHGIERKYKEAFAEYRKTLARLYDELSMSKDLHLGEEVLEQPQEIPTEALNGDDENIKDESLVPKDVEVISDAEVSVLEEMIAFVRGHLKRNQNESSGYRNAYLETSLALLLVEGDSVHRVPRKDLMKKLPDDIAAHQFDRIIRDSSLFDKPEIGVWELSPEGFALFADNKSAEELKEKILKHFNIEYVRSEE